MQNPCYSLTVDGCVYDVEVGSDGDVIWIYEAVTGMMIASGENDAVAESFIFDQMDFPGSQKDLYEKGWREQATWLISTMGG